jgi:hypothetical protein
MDLVLPVLGNMRIFRRRIAMNTTLVSTMGFAAALLAIVTVLPAASAWGGGSSLLSCASNEVPSCSEFPPGIPQGVLVECVPSAEGEGCVVGGVPITVDCFVAAAAPADAVDACSATVRATRASALNALGAVAGLCPPGACTINIEGGTGSGGPVELKIHCYGWAALACLGVVVGVILLVALL